MSTTTRGNAGSRNVDRSDRIPDLDLRSPMIYEAAIARLRYWRGAASAHPCSNCEAPALKWFYRGGCFYELRERRPRYKGRGTKVVTFSPDPMAYDPLCGPCHFESTATRASGW